MRSGQYKTINATPVFEHDLKKINRLTGEIEFYDNPKPSTKIVGYVGYFRLINGFEKALYMTREQLEAHGKKYSQSYKSKKDWVVKSSLWTTDFDSMATKTVLKLLLSKYGPMSIDMQTAIKSDQASFNKDVINGDIDGNIKYPDNNIQNEENDKAVDTAFTEVNDNNKLDYDSQKDGEQKDMLKGTPFED